MSITLVRKSQIRPLNIIRSDINTTTSGSALITKVIAGTGLSLSSSTGVNPGTGDVTIALSIATASVLGGVKIGSGLTVAVDGTISVNLVSLTWGSITGTLSHQTDLQAALNAKYNNPTGTTSQYIDGTGALRTFPTDLATQAFVTNNFVRLDGTSIVQNTLNINSNEMGGTLRSWMTRGVLVGGGGSDGAYFGMKVIGANDAQAVIAWGDDSGDNLHFINASSGGPLDGVTYMTLFGLTNIIRMYTNLDVQSTISAAQGNSVQWSEAYSWGNHSSVGYLTGFTETDPTVPAHVKAITTTNISNWNTAYSWGDHASAGYLTSIPAHTHTIANVTGLQTALDGKLSTSGTAANSELLDGIDSPRIVFGESGRRKGTNFISNWNQNDHPDVAFLSAENGATNAPSGDFTYGLQYSFHRSGAAYRTQFVTSLYSDLDLWVRNSRDGDVFTSWKRLWHSGDFTSTDVSNWNTAYSYGNHASAGYATQTYVNTAVSNLVDAAPGTLDTLNELAAALGDDPNFATTVTNSIATKLPLAGGVMNTGAQIVGASRGDDVYGGLIQIRERDYVIQNQSDWSYSPAITFHWGNRWAKRFGGRFDGLFAIDDEPIALRSWVTSQGFITGYTETDTLASVTGRGATTNTASVFRGGLYAQKAQVAGNYTTAALWTESYDNTTTGIAFHISGNVGKFLEMRTDGILYWEERQVWTAGTLTNLSQLTNGPGYLTSLPSHNHDDRYYTESESDAKYLIGTTNPGTPGNFTLSIGNNGSFSYIQSHSSQPLRLNPLGNALQGPSGSTIWHSGNLTDLNQLTNSPGYITSSSLSAYLPLAGGTMSGSINMNGNNVINIGQVNATHAIFTNDASSRVMYLRGTGNIIQFQDAAAANKWEVVGRQDQFYIFKNDGIGSGMKYVIDSSGNHTIYNDLTVTGSFSASGYNKSNWDTAYSWGDHASAGYRLNSVNNTAYVYAITYRTENYNFTLDPRQSIDSMSIKLWDNYFNNSGLGVDYGSLLDIHGRGGHVHSQFYMDAGGGLFYRMSPYAGGWSSWASIWTSSSLTNLNQLVNGPGYITGYTETDTLNSVTTRGASTSNSISVGGLIVTTRDVDVRTHQGRFQVYNASGTGNLGYRIQTDEQGGWRWQFVDGGNNEYFGVEYASGNLVARGTITEQSSLRYKENIINLESITDKVDRLRPVRYNKIGNTTNEIGLIAEEVAEIFPEFVNYNVDGQVESLNYTRLTVVLLQTVKELSDKINKLETK